MAAKKYNLNTQIRSALRKIWLYSPERKEVVRRCLRAYGQSECEKCRRLVAKIQVDHKEPAGSLVEGQEQEFIRRLLRCGASNLEGLCISCHAAKTLKEAGTRAAVRKASKNAT